VGYGARFGIATDAWERHENKEKTSVRFFRRSGVDEFWAYSTGRTAMGYFEFSYLRLAKHQFWWGSSTFDQGHAMCFFPLDQLSWVLLKPEQFAGEMCDVVESADIKTGTKSQRFWVSQQTGRVCGVLAYFGQSSPNELVQFHDYREVSPGVWLPYHEVRSVGYGNGGWLRRSELVVTEARTGVDLAERYASLLPKEGDRVQDQRFAAAVDLTYSAKRTDEEIRELADAEYKRQLEGQEEFKRLVKPLNDLFGQPAPALPTEGWVGGERPNVAGSPYLLHFWSTWCGPCKADLPRLKALSEKGFIVVGMHPPGTPATEVEQVIAEQKLRYPTLLAAGKGGNTKSLTIGGYPAGVFPYCVVVDAQGRVAGHGPLSDMIGTAEALRRPKEPGGTNPR
jgi:thiol-disulfide isomerase/thioredoxin